MPTTRCTSLLIALLLVFFTCPARPQTLANQTITAIDARITYIGDWVNQDNGGHFFTSTEGSFALDFSGSAVYWYSRKLYDGAVAAVTLDDGGVVYIDLSEGVSQNSTPVVSVLFEQEGLALNESHRLNVSWNGPGSNGVGAFLESYRIIYTSNVSGSSTSSASQASSTTSSPTPSSSSSSGSNAGAIVGGTVGGVFGVLILILGLFYLRRRHSRIAGAESMQSATPFLAMQGPTQISRNDIQSSTPSTKPPLDSQHPPSQRQDSRLFVPADATRSPSLLSPGSGIPRATLPLRTQNSRFTFLPSWYRPRSESSSQLQGVQHDTSSSGRSFNAPFTPTAMFPPPSSGITEAIHDPPPMYRG